jgi:hypothetical protein
MNKDGKDPIQGEGDRVSARLYDQKVREFVADGNVEGAANEARAYVERHPRDAKASERKAKRGPTTPFVSLEDIVAKGTTMIERVRPIVARAAANLRARFSKK